MDVKGKDYLYECYPPVFGNEDQSVKVKLKCVPKPDFDIQAEQESTYGLEERRRKGREFVSKYVHSIEGLTVDGKPIKTLDDLYTDGPSDLYNWVYSAVFSREVLTKAEIKN